MKKLVFVSILLVGLVACGNKEAKKQEAVESASSTTVVKESIDDGHHAQNALSYGGVYEGRIPCADCPGIDVVITLDYDGNYTKKMTYSDREPDNVFDSSGRFVWSENGSRITLVEEGGEHYKVVEGALIMLDEEGEVIGGEHAAMYRLRQTVISE
ncbi:copper resistance protein NlpE [Parabacteroides sp. OttesenSCG-928-N08]|nr:copper resistance protein NlpE [Parabacteroides sp. OttesenSCG-928-N08]